MSNNLNWATNLPESANGSMCFYDNYYYFVSFFNVVKIDLYGNVIDPEWAVINDPEDDYNLLYCIAYNGYLYVNNYATSGVFGGSNTICKISISNPDVDYDYNWFTGLNYATNMAIQDDYLYITCDISNVVSKISLSNPSDYTPNWATSTQGIAGPDGICIYNNYVYVSNSLYNYTTNVYDVNSIVKISLSDPDGDFTLNWATSDQGVVGPTSLAIYNNYLYVSNSNEYINNFQTISQISLSQPTTDYNPSWVQSSNEPVPLAAIESIYINGNYLYSYNPYTYVISQYSLPSSLACFKEDTKILTDKGYVKIQELKNGDLVKTLKHDYKPIVMIGKRDMYHPMLVERIKDQLYKCTQDKYPEVFEDLILTGCHSILVDGFISEKEKDMTIKVNGNIYETDDKLRLPACVDERAVIYNKSGNYTIYHLALENDNYYMNYGIYANGLLVETCSKRYLKELSNMDLIE
jgi:hypothetical protein